MDKTGAIMTGGCQCGAVRYALSEKPESTVCHCRMCQKAVGAVRRVLQGKDRRFALDPGVAVELPEFIGRRTPVCAACGTPLTVRYLDGDAIEVTTGSLDDATAVPPTMNFGSEARLPWIDRLLPGRLPDTPTSASSSATREIVSHQHPDHDTVDG